MKISARFLQPGDVLLNFFGVSRQTVQRAEVDGQGYEVKVTFATAEEVASDCKSNVDWIMCDTKVEIERGPEPVGVVAKRLLKGIKS